ncbi:gluconokinase [Hyphomonas sp.]|uniref:gluconokinase n=1 Tax=Hyphomonas sp. TaxID=87 RepID=UPI003918CA8A
MIRPCTVIVMGVSGSGKSTLANSLGSHVGWPVIEGDDYHSAANRQKMAAGIPLENTDRRDWISALCSAIRQAGPASVTACSALNPAVRGWIEAGTGCQPLYLWLSGDQTLVAERLRRRTGHFMNPHLLGSQFEALDPPASAIIIPVSMAPDEQLRCAVEALRLRTDP